MNTQVLQIILKLRGLSQSDLARMAQVSRQAASLWFKKEVNINIQSSHLSKLAKALNLKIDDLCDPLPLLEETSQKKELEVSLIWDHLYPSLQDFVIALVQKKPRALSRLVETYGLFQSEKIIGKMVWTKFHEYKKNLPPIKRKQCEQLWNLNQILH